MTGTTAHRAVRSGAEGTPSDLVRLREVAQSPSVEGVVEAVRELLGMDVAFTTPFGFAGEEIPVASRIVFVCDAYQAMVKDRPYRQALSPEAARAEIEAGVGTQFWPRAARALLDILDAGMKADDR